MIPEVPIEMLLADRVAARLRTDLALARVDRVDAISEVLLTPDQIAKRLAVSRSMAYALIKRGLIKALYIGRLPRVSEADLAAYLARARR